MLLAPTPFKFVHIFGKGVGARRGARCATLIDYPVSTGGVAKIEIDRNQQRGERSPKSAESAVNGTHYRITYYQIKYALWSNENVIP